MEIRSVLFVLLGTALGIFFGTVYNTSEISENVLKAHTVVRDSNKLGEESLGTVVAVTDSSIQIFFETSDEIPSRTIQFTFSDTLEVYKITHAHTQNIYRAETLSSVHRNTLARGQMVYVKHYLKEDRIFAEQIFIMQ